MQGMSCGEYELAVEGCHVWCVVLVGVVVFVCVCGSLCCRYAGYAM